MLAVDIVDAGEGVEFVDLGLDPATGAVTLVGSENVEGEAVAEVFYLSSDRSTLSSEVLVGLGPDTNVFGVSSDGSRAAGVSKSPESEDVGEGTTWHTSAPDSPVGIGFVDGFRPTSVAAGAWSGGVVGDYDGARSAVTWNPDQGLAILPDAGALSIAFDVTADGVIAVGLDGGFPSYWNAVGSNILANPGSNSGRALAISPNAEFIGGGLDFLDTTPVFDAGRQATLWSKVDGIYQESRLTWADGSRFKGEVQDVSNSGYAVGDTTDGRGFIWHSSFDGVQTPFDGPQIFDTWLQNIEGGASLPTPSTAVVAVAEDFRQGKLMFAVGGSAYFVQADIDGLTAVTFNPLAAGFTAVDMGHNPFTNTTYLVGQMTHGDGSETAAIVDAVSLGLLDDIPEYETLVGLGPDTFIGGISPEGSRVAGVSKSPLSEDVGEGTTWLSSDPSSPVGIGFVEGFRPTTVAAGAWSGGVVGHYDGLRSAITWTSEDGIQILPDSGALSTTFDVSFSGAVKVGLDGGLPSYWDDADLKILSNAVGNSGRAITISPNADYIGGGLDFLDFTPVLDAGRQATLWSKVDGVYQENRLTWADDARVKGEVVDVTDSGYSVIALTEGGAAIYREDMGIVTMVEFVGFYGDGAELPDPNDVPIALSETQDGRLLVANESSVIEIFGLDFPLTDEADLVATSFNAVSDHVLNAETDVVFTVLNQGTVDAAAFQTHVVWSLNETLGDSDDRVVPNSVKTISGLAAGATVTHSVAASIDRASLYGHALSNTPSGDSVGTISGEVSRLFLIIDSNSEVAEADEDNNAGQGHLIDSDDIIYFPWDKNGNGTVEPLEALSSVRAIGTHDVTSDFDGNGIVTPLEALSALQRIGYVRNDAVTSAASGKTAKVVELAPTLSSATSVPEISVELKSTVRPLAVGPRWNFSALMDDSVPELFAATDSDHPSNIMTPVIDEELAAVDYQFESVTDWLNVV